MSDPTVFGAYEVERLIGTGGFADVFSCYHPGLQTTVAIKVLHAHLARNAEICERFLHEAQVLWRADSDRVIQVTHVDTLPDGRPYFVMRLADRGSLIDVVHDHRTRTGRLHSLRETVGLAHDLVGCVAALRDRNLVHRDLKPANVLVKSIGTPDHMRTERWGLPSDERLVLADFGLAKRLSEGTNLISQLGGTPAYMAPEMVDINADVTWRVDLFSLGVMVFEIAAGELPWPERRFEHVREVDDDRLTIGRWRQDFPTGFDQVIHRATALDPMDRYDSPEEFAGELEALLGQEPATGDTPGSIERVRVLADARRRLDEPVRIGIVGGDRVSAVPLGLKVMGQRPSAGEASLLSSVVVRVRHGEPALTARLHSGEEVAGSWEVDDQGRFVYRVPAMPWSIAEVVVDVDQPDFAGTEVIDVPRGLLHRDRDAVRALWDLFDVAIVGVPADASGERFAVDEVLSLSRQGGPFALIGARKLGQAGPGAHPTLAATVPADDTIELKVLLGELLGGERDADCRAARALMMLRQCIYHGRLAGDWDDHVAAIHADFPAIEELTVARHDLVASPWSDDVRADLHRLLGRRVASARLHADPDADVDELLARTREAARRWTGHMPTSAYVAQVAARSLHHLDAALRERRDRQAS